MSSAACNVDLTSDVTLVVVVLSLLLSDLCGCVICEARVRGVLLLRAMVIRFLLLFRRSIVKVASDIHDRTEYTGSNSGQCWQYRLMVDLGKAASKSDLPDVDA